MKIFLFPAHNELNNYYKMDQLDCNKTIICRCCLQSDIKETFQSLSCRLLDMFMALTTFKVPYDIGPWWICSTCVEQLSRCYEFQNRCKISNDFFINKLSSNYDLKEDMKASQLNNLSYKDNTKHEQCHPNNRISSAKHIYQYLVNIWESKNVYCSSCRKILKKMLSVRKHFERHKCHCERYTVSNLTYDIDLKSGINTYQNGNSSLQILPEDNNQYGMYPAVDQVVKSEQDVNTHTHNFINYISATDENVESFKSEDKNIFDFQYKCAATIEYDKNKDDSIKLKMKTENDVSDEHIHSSCELHSCGSHTDSEDDRPLKVIKQESFNCSNCNENFGDINQFQKHMHTHQWPMERSCDLCGKEFKTLRGLRLHKVIHADVRKFVCNVCGKGFVFDYKLKQHTRTHTNEKSYACEHCGKMYKTMRILKIHYLTHASEKLFSCRNCAKCFRTEHNLKAHVKRCGGNKDYICNECGKAFVNKTELLIHMRAHTKEKPYSCAHCDKSFKTQSHRAVHIRSHTGERPHKCLECGKCFMINRTLKIHMRIHSGELPYPCTICSRRFRQPNVLKTHMKVHKILTFDNP